MSGIQGKLAPNHGNWSLEECSRWILLVFKIQVTGPTPRWRQEATIPPDTMFTVYNPSSSADTALKTV